MALMVTCLVWLRRVDWVENNLSLIFNKEAFYNPEKAFLAHFANLTDNLDLLRSWDGRVLTEYALKGDAEGLQSTNGTFFTMYSPSNGKCLQAVPELGKAAFRVCASNVSQYWRWTGGVTSVTRANRQNGRVKFYYTSLAGRMISSFKYPGLCLSYAGALRDCRMGADAFEGALHWRCNNSVIEDNSRSVDKPGFPLRIPFDNQLPTKRDINTVLAKSLKQYPYVPGAIQWFDNRTGSFVCDFY